jgi:hypothetical protein
VTVSTADIPVLHSTEVVHFHCESGFTLSLEVANLLTHFQGRSAEFTMKSFKGSSNKLGPLDFTRQTDVEPSNLWQAFETIVLRGYLRKRDTTKDA